MTHFIKILIAGVVATTSQRMLGFSPLSIEGFAFFMVVFVVISLALHFVLPKKETEDEAPPIAEVCEKSPEEKKSDNMVFAIGIVVALVFGGFLFYDYHQSQLWKAQLAAEASAMEALKQQKQLDQEKAKKAHEKTQQEHPQDLSGLTTQELVNLINTFYLETAFLKKTRYAIKLFDEFDSRNQREHETDDNVNVLGLKILLMAYLDVFKKNEQLNKLMQKFDFGAVYSFILPITRASLDASATVKTSHLRIVDMKNHYRFFLNTENIDKVKPVVINRIKGLTQEDKEEINSLITKLVHRINLIEQQYLIHAQAIKTKGQKNERN